MLRHLFTISIRNILKHFNYSLLNISGLAIGIASFLFIMIYVNDEVSFDRFHEDYERIYRVNRLYNSNDINEDAATMSFPFGPAVAEAYPDMIETMVRFFDFQVNSMLFEYEHDSSDIRKFNEEWFYLADSAVFQLFAFNLIKGDPLTALERPNTIVLTESTARRYFGDEDPMGKIMTIEEQLEFEVSGIMEDLPPQSHFRIDILGSMSTYRQLRQGHMPDTWIWNPCWTYIRLHENVSQAQFESLMPEFYLNHYADFQDQEISIYLQPLADIHLQSHHEYEMHPNGKLSYIRILALIALSVLVLACINFMNLSTASSGGRGAEIGMKKVAGATKAQLRLQFLGESFMITAIALLLALIVVELFLPLFNNFTGKEIPNGLIVQARSIGLGLALLLFVGLLSGSYPAFFLSGLDTSHLKDGLRSGMGKGLARKLLVLVQFLVSIALIISTFSAWSQLNYLKTADLGFNRDQIILLPTNFNLGMQFESFSQELKKHPDIEHVTGMEDILGANHNTRSFVIEGMFDDQPFWYPAFLVRWDFIETFQIPVVAGRAFSRDFPSDTSEAIMINESMVRHLGWTNEEALGRAIRSDGNERVIGVFADFNALSLHKPVDNFVLDMLEHPRGAAGLTRYMALRVNSDNYGELLKFIELTWKDFAPTRPFEYSFLDEELNALYRDESSFSKFSLALTILAIVIACLGLVGLTSFMVERKTKEISIRRVHGATVTQVNRILSREFLFLILLANLISWPLTWFGISRWLQSFSKHIEMQWYLFILAGLLTVIITMMITLYHAYRSALLNPANTLKYE